MRRARRADQCPQAAGSASQASGGEHPVPPGVRDDRQDGQRGVGGASAAASSTDVVHLVGPARPPAVPFGEAGDQQVVGVVVLGVAAAQLGEGVEHLALGAEGAGEQQPAEPGGGVGGGARAAAVSQASRAWSGPPCRAARVHEGQGEECGGVGGAGLGGQPVARPGGGVGSSGEHGEAVAAAVPVVAGVHQQGAGGLPPAPAPARPGRCAVPRRRGRRPGDRSRPGRSRRTGPWGARRAPSRGGRGGTAGASCFSGCHRPITHSKPSAKGRVKRNGGLIDFNFPAGSGT